MSRAFSDAYARRASPNVVRRLDAAVEAAFDTIVDRERTERYALSPAELEELLHAASRPQKVAV
jgi:hypothetical protein